jgi:hypothetical protein
MVEIIPIELDESTKQWIEWFTKLKEETDKYIHERLGISADHLGVPAPRSEEKTSSLLLQQDDTKTGVFNG